MQGTYFLCGIIIAALVLWPEETANIFTSISLKIQIYYINYRMKWMAWCMYRRLKRLTKDAGFPDPGPFRYVNLWDRDQP